MIPLGKYYLQNGSLSKFSQTEGQNSALLAEWINPLIEFVWRGSGSRIPFFSGQYHRLQETVNCLNLSLSGILDENQFHDDLIRLIQKNRFFKGAKIRMFIQPDPYIDHGAKILVLCTDHPEDQYAINERGLIIAPSETHPHPGKCTLMLSGKESFRGLQWIHEAQSAEIDEIFFQDADRFLLESPFARIYLVKGNKVFTPDHEQLTHWGIEQEIQAALDELGKTLSRSPSIQTAHLQQAEEVFLADDYRGIQWVMGYFEKRYFRKLSQKLVALINQRWLNA